MTTVFPSRDTQKLRILRTDGQVSGFLQCSVSIAFGVHGVLCFEDNLLGVSVPDVLNPLEGGFLADEVQRLMRIGVAAWLEAELRADRLLECQQPAADDDWDVRFRLPTADGRDCDLHVGVPASTAPEQVVRCALERVERWSAALDRRVPDAELQEILAGLDLRDAPRLSCGLARITLTRPGAI